MAGWVSMKRASLLIAVLACHTSGPDRATAAPAGCVARTTAVDGATYRYRVFVPRHMGRARPPVILSLHGAGERGSDGELQTMVGLGPVVRGRAESFPAVVVFPQAPLDSLWRGAPARAALQALDARLLEFRGDSTRVYLTGLSMGGYGTGQLALEHPRRVAPAAPKDHAGMRAAVGFRVKSGWATAVLLAGPAAAPRVVDRRVIELSDPAVPTSRQPYHAVMGASGGDAGARLEKHLTKLVERVTRRSVRRLLQAYRRAGHPARRAGLVVGSVIDPARIANDHIRAHALEGRLFRTVLERAVRSFRLPCAVIVERGA